MAETGEYGMMFGRKVDDLDGCPAWDPVRFAKRDRSVASLFNSSKRLSFVLEHFPIPGIRRCGHIPSTHMFRRIK